MKGLLPPQPPAAAAAGALLEDKMCWKETLTSSLLHLKTRGFQKAVVFSRETLRPCFAVTVSVSLHSLSLTDLAHQAKVLEGGSWQPCQASLKLLAGRSCCHAPDPPWVDWTGDATFSFPGPNITEMLARVSLQDGKRGAQEQILDFRPHHPIQLWAQQLSVNTLPCKETLLGLRDACR